MKNNSKKYKANHMLYILVVVKFFFIIIKLLIANIKKT